jgi:hypothetical protein
MGIILSCKNVFNIINTKKQIDFPFTPILNTENSPANVKYAFSAIDIANESETEHRFDEKASELAIDKAGLDIACKERLIVFKQHVWNITGEYPIILYPAVYEMTAVSGGREMEERDIGFG